jgi:hypothetical protein
MSCAVPLMEYERFFVTRVQASERVSERERIAQRPGSFRLDSRLGAYIRLRNAESLSDCCSSGLSAKSKLSFHCNCESI